MLITVTRDEDNVDVEVDTERYKLDANYKRHIHEQLNWADNQKDLDWDYLCATEEELDAMGEKPVFDSDDYPTHEAAMEALDKLLQDILEEVKREVAAENRALSASA
jgi:hypothetical protein